jgi:hypothetical protein
MLTESRPSDAFLDFVVLESRQGVIFGRFLGILRCYLWFTVTVTVVVAIVGFVEFHGVTGWMIECAVKVCKSLRRIIASRFSSAVEDNKYSSSSNLFVVLDLSFCPKVVED